MHIRKYSDFRSPGLPLGASLLTAANFGRFNEICHDNVAHALGAFSCLVGLRAAAATIGGCIEPGGKLLRWSVGHDARCSTTYGAREPVGDVFFQI